MVNRLGEVRKNRLGYKMWINEYINDQDLWVKFHDGYKVHTNWQRFKMGWVRNPNNRTVFGKGYMGIGKYNSKDYPRIYQVWRAMLDRCYNPQTQKKFPKYKGIKVSDQFKCFQNFAKWYEKNYWEFGNDELMNRMEIDKDLLQWNTDTKIYSESTCLIIPKFINVIFETKSKSDGLPPCISRRYNRYVAACHGYKKTFATIDEAKIAYKQEKEKYVRSVAEQYKDELQDKVYKAMMEWRYIID